MPTRSLDLSETYEITNASLIDRPEPHPLIVTLQTEHLPEDTMSSLALTKKEVTADKDIQIHLALTAETLAVLDDLTYDLEASSIAEVIRRAIHAYEHIEIDADLPLLSDNLNVLPFHRPGDRDQASAGFIKRHVRVPQRTKDRLDAIKKETDGTYSTVITGAVIALAQLVRMRNRLRKNEDNEDHNRSGLDASQQADMDNRGLLEALLA